MCMHVYVIQSVGRFGWLISVCSTFTQVGITNERLENGVYDRIVEKISPNGIPMKRAFLLWYRGELLSWAGYGGS